MTDIVAIALTALAGILSSTVVAFAQRYFAPSVQANAKAKPLEERLSELGDLMRSSALVLEEVRAEIQARLALAEKAKRDAEDAEQVAQLNEAQRAALARLVRAELASEVDRTTRRTFWQGFGTNLLFFIAGAGVSILTTIWLS